MSADRWSVCPKCLKDDIEAKRKALEEVKKQYGKIAPEKWMKMLQEATKRQEEEPAHTLREDYGFYLDPTTHQFHAFYTAYCNVCGWGYDFKQEEQAKVEDEADKG